MSILAGIILFLFLASMITLEIILKAEESRDEVPEEDRKEYDDKDNK